MDQDAMLKFREAVSAVCEDLREAWEEFISDLAQQIYDIRNGRREIEQEYDLRSTWHVCHDTRRPHQVYNRRPMYKPQKII